MGLLLIVTKLPLLIYVGWWVCRGANQSDHSSSSHGKEIECSQQSMSDDNDTKAARKVSEVVCNSAESFLS
jgi:lipopolysaccharide biosynthesis regulator YciM